MPNIFIECSYLMSSRTKVSLPENKLEDNITSINVKWGTAYIEFDDGSNIMVELNEASLDSVDWKYPERYTAFTTDDTDEYPDYARPLL